MSNKCTRLITLSYACPKQKPTKPSYSSMAGLETWTHITISIPLFDFCCCKHWRRASWEGAPSGEWALAIRGDFRGRFHFIECHQKSQGHSDINSCLFPTLQAHTSCRCLRKGLKVSKNKHQPFCLETVLSPSLRSIWEGPLIQNFGTWKNGTIKTTVPLGVRKVPPTLSPWNLENLTYVFHHWLMKKLGGGKESGNLSVSFLI